MGYDNLVKMRKAEGRMASFNPRAHEEYAAAFKLIDLTAAQQDHDRLSSSSEDSSSCSSSTEEDEYEEEDQGLWGAMFGRASTHTSKKKKKKKKKDKKDKKDKKSKKEDDWHIDPAG